MVRADLAQAWGPGLLAGLQQDLEVEPKAAPDAQHLFERGEVDGVLPLVVRGASAVPAVALDHDPPGIQPGTPPPRLTEDNVCVAVEEHGRHPVVLMAPGDEERPAAGRVVHDARGAA